VFIVSPLARLGEESERYLEYFISFKEGKISDEEFQEIKKRYISLTEMYGNCGGD